MQNALKQAVKQLCRTRGLTQRELAPQLGISQQTLSGILSRGNPQLDTLERFADFFHCSLDELTGRASNREERG